MGINTGKLSEIDAENVKSIHMGTNRPLISTITDCVCSDTSLSRKNAHPTNGEGIRSSECVATIPPFGVTESNRSSAMVSSESGEKDNVKCEANDNVHLPVSFINLNTNGLNNETMEYEQHRAARTWLLVPFSSQDSDFDGDKDDFIDTLLHVAEDKMYLFGFSYRSGRSELTGSCRPSRRKRCRGSSNTRQTTAKQDGLGSLLVSSSQCASFSFVNWQQYGCKEVNNYGAQCQSLTADDLLSFEERHVLSRYALSNGKLRKECADPYQFFTTRLQELRHSIEESSTRVR
uniref:WGS project CAEQ00000000 data, annotated contig 129 n=1 Tax=Trypanosoma congolense (strain IL3000) TaxID=1068625 RepID=F9W597_TRYCI|nr:unnamed protein product [Trypanosoma congolense IL3000]